MAPPSDNESSDNNSESDRYRARRRYSQRRPTQDAWLAPSQPPEQGPDGSYLRPPGRAPVDGFNWSSTRGVWVPGKRLLDEMQLSRHQTVRRRAPMPPKQRRTSGKGDAAERDAAAAAVKPKRKYRKRSAIAEEISSDFEDFSEAQSSSAGGGTARSRGRKTGKRSAPPVAQVNFRTGDRDISTGSRKRAKALPTTAAAASSSHASSAASSLKSPPSVDATARPKSPPPSPTDVPEDPYHPASMWKEPKPGPFESDLTLYEKQRKPRPAPQGRFQCPVSLLKQEFRCVICLDYINNARIVRECLHRFCEGCIEKSIVQGRKECPICRVHIPSRRSLAPDPDFDTLIQHIVKNNQGHHDDDGDDDGAHSDEERPAPTRASRILQRAIRKRLLRQNKASGIEDDDDEEEEEEDSKGEDVTTSEEEEETDRKVAATPEDEPAIGDSSAAENKEAAAAAAADTLRPSSPPDNKDDQPSLIKVVLIRLRKERTVMDDLQMPFLTLSDDAPVSVLQQFLRQKHGFRFPNFDILLYYKNCGGVPILAPSNLSLREFVSTYSSRFVLDNAAGYLPLYYRVQRQPRD